MCVISHGTDENFWLFFCMCGINEYVEVQEEVKQAIPQFYATGAEETFLAIRKQKEEEWKNHSEEEQAHLRKVLDQLEDDIKSQQEMAALLREDLEEVQKIEDSDMPEIDEEMQKRYDDMIKQQMEEKLSLKIQAEDVKRKWLLDEVISKSW